MAQRLGHAMSEVTEHSDAVLRVGAKVAGGAKKEKKTKKRKGHYLVG